MLPRFSAATMHTANDFGGEILLNLTAEVHHLDVRETNGRRSDNLETVQQCTEQSVPILY